MRYGGNTPCLSVEISGEPLYVFDCGIGVKRLSDHRAASKVQRLSARVFITHTHWDHINTIPFFGPLCVRRNRIAPDTQRTGNRFRIELRLSPR